MRLCTQIESVMSNTSLGMLTAGVILLPGATSGSSKKFLTTLAAGEMGWFWTLAASSSIAPLYHESMQSLMCSFYTIDATIRGHTAQLPSLGDRETGGSNSGSSLFASAPLGKSPRLRENCAA